MVNTPKYAYRCEHCGTTKDKYLPLEQCSALVMCAVCVKPMYKDLSQVSLLIDQTIGKYDEGLGRFIESSSHKRQVMKELGVEQVGSLSEIKQKTVTKEQKLKEYETMVADSLGKG